MSWPTTIASAPVTSTKAAPNSSASGSSSWSGYHPAYVVRLHDLRQIEPRPILLKFLSTADLP